MYIVKLDKDCWLADWEGDPGRTTRIMKSKVFLVKASAELALEKARKYRNFRSAEIQSIEDTEYEFFENEMVTDYWWYRKFSCNHLYLDGKFELIYGKGKVLLSVYNENRAHSIEVKNPTIYNIENLVKMLCVN